MNVFLVEHPAGLCLFDTGQSARAASTGYFPSWHPFLLLARFELRPDDEAGNQLRRCGIELKAIRWVALSHLHTDHVGGLDAFTHAEVLVTRTEWERAAGIRGRIRGYLPQYWPSGLEPRLIEFDGPAVGPFVSSVDVAGDGRLLLVPTPGHTPGHMALLVRRDAGDFLCGGDLAPSAAELTQAAPGLAEYCKTEGIVFLGAHDPVAPRLLDWSRS